MLRRAGCQCCAVSQVICHGIPDMRPIEDGDVVNLDVTVYIGAPKHRPWPLTVRISAVPVLVRRRSWNGIYSEPPLYCATAVTTAVDL
jgi:methionine aminopeptidase